MATLLDAYDKLVLRKPGITLLVIALVVAFFAYHAPAFRLDASADSLVLENDEALEYYRSIRARYGSDDYLIVTYAPKEDLFSEQVLADLQALRDEVAAMENVESVISLLDVPLIQSPAVTLSDLNEEVPNLRSPGTDKALAREEFLSSPMYRDLIISADGRTTAMQVNFRRDETWHELLKQRNDLREKGLQSELTAEEEGTLDAVSAQFDAHSLALRDRQSKDIARVRDIIDRHRDAADLHLGGVPMIASDSIDFIRHDLLTFGVGVLCFLVVILAVAFRKPRWVILPMLACAAAGVIMVGFLGLVDWPVTVVSSNFMSLLLILTLSLAIHLVVRYRELHEETPDAEQEVLVREMVRAKTVPCLYTAITTMVAFGSLLFSGIRPVIDFGWMMAVGIAVAFLLVFSLMPAALVLLEPGRPHRRPLRLWGERRLPQRRLGPLAVLEAHRGRIRSLPGVRAAQRGPSGQRGGQLPLVVPPPPHLQPLVRAGPHLRLGPSRESGELPDLHRTPERPLRERGPLRVQRPTPGRTAPRGLRDRGRGRDPGGQLRLGPVPARGRFRPEAADQRPDLHVVRALLRRACQRVLRPPGDQPPGLRRRRAPAARHRPAASSPPPASARYVRGSPAAR